MPPNRVVSAIQGSKMIHLARIGSFSFFSCEGAGGKCERWGGRWDFQFLILGSAYACEWITVIFCMN